MPSGLCWFGFHIIGVQFWNNRYYIDTLPLALNWTLGDLWHNKHVFYLCGQVTQNVSTSSDLIFHMLLSCLFYCTQQFNNNTVISLIYLPLIIKCGAIRNSSLFIRSYVQIWTRRVPHMEKELLTLSSPPVFSGIRVARVDRCLSFFLLLFALVVPPYFLPLWCPLNLIPTFLFIVHVLYIEFLICQYQRRYGHL